MSNPQVIEEIPVNLVEVKEMLKKIKERDQELNFRAQKTDEYLQALTTIKPKQAEELKEKIMSLNISRLKEQHVQKFIDVMPITLDSVKTVISGFNVSLTGDQVKKIADVIKEFAPDLKKGEKKKEEAAAE